MKTFKKTLSVQIEVSQNVEFSSGAALHLWIAPCLNCNTNNREVGITVDGATYGPEVRDAQAGEPA